MWEQIKALKKHAYSLAQLAHGLSVVVQQGSAARKGADTTWDGEGRLVALGAGELSTRFASCPPAFGLLLDLRKAR